MEDHININMLPGAGRPPGVARRGGLAARERVSPGAGGAGDPCHQVRRLEEQEHCLQVLSRAQWRGGAGEEAA